MFDGTLRTGLPVIRSPIRSDLFWSRDIIAQELCTLPPIPPEVRCQHFSSRCPERTCKDLQYWFWLCLVRTLEERLLLEAAGLQRLATRSPCFHQADCIVLSCPGASLGAPGCPAAPGPLGCRFQEQLQPVKGIDSPGYFSSSYENSGSLLLFRFLLNLYLKP